MLKDDHALRCEPFLSLNNVELDLLSLRKRAKAFASNGAMMDEDILSTRALDKAKAFSIVEPFYGSCLAVCHFFYPL